ncbi:MAG: hypothetical protein LQ338_004798 [Usnochroma carphineum]|nr:MAG: hypothetical protein LQ338_004798 [Usnochroma carphineum]
MARELVLCYCKQCNRHICTTSNSWTQLDAGFSIPGDSKLFANPGLIVSGQRKPAQGHLKDCVLQSLVCAGCEAFIGCICVEASREKKRYRDRSFLFLNTLSMKSMANGQPVEPCVRTKDPASSKDLHSYPEASQGTSAVSTAASKHPSTAPLGQMNGNVSPSPSLQEDTKALLEGQRKDIDRIAVNVDNLLQDMKTMKSTMAYLKFQQTTFSTYTDYHEGAKSPSALAEDVQVLAERVSHLSARVDEREGNSQHHQSPNGSVPSDNIKSAYRINHVSRELRALSERVYNVSKSINEVDAIKLELKHMNRRLKRLEDADGYPPMSDLAPSSEAPFHATVQRRSEPICNETGTSQEVPSSTIERSQSGSTAARRKSTDSALSVQENGYDYLSDEAQTEPRSQSRNLSDKEITPEPNLVELLRPQITSAEKVAALKRRREQSSSSSSSASPVPPHKRPPGRPRIHAKRGWKVKPSIDASAKKKLTSVNDPEHVLTSDPEDSDFDPFSLPDDFAGPHSKDNSRPRVKAPIRLPTPEWEKPDWGGPPTSFASNSNRGKGISRRGVSGRGSLSDRDTVRRSSSGYGKGHYVVTQYPEHWEDHSPSPDIFAKPRDSQGRLLRPDGRVDGRSLRYQRARQAGPKLAARQQMAQQQKPNNEQPAIVKGQQNGMQAEGSSAPARPNEYVDTAALKAAGYTVSAANPGSRPGGASNSIPTSLESANGEPVKQEPEASGPSGLTSTAMTAPLQGGGGKHAKLMNQVFPWR